jgi:hypothetical protein
MLRRILAAGFGAGAMLAAGSAGATILEVSYSDSLYSGTWEQSSDPTPIQYQAGVATVIPVWDVTGNLGITGNEISYYNSAWSGGVGMWAGPQVYTGPESAPVFSAGSFTGLYDPIPPTSSGGVLTFTVVVPELSTWGMMLTGFAGLTAVAAGKRRRALAA